MNTKLFPASSVVHPRLSIELPLPEAHLLRSYWTECVLPRKVEVPREWSGNCSGRQESVHSRLSREPEVRCPSPQSGWVPPKSTSRRYASAWWHVLSVALVVSTWAEPSGTRTHGWAKWKPGLPPIRRASWWATVSWKSTARMCWDSGSVLSPSGCTLEMTMFDSSCGILGWSTTELFG